MNTMNTAVPKQENLMKTRKKTPDMATHNDIDLGISIIPACFDFSTFET